MALGRNRGGRFVEDRTTGKWTYIPNHERPTYEKKGWGKGYEHTKDDKPWEDTEQCP